MEEKNQEEKVTVRHTINAEETFTLAKDVYDIRNLIKNVYNNRAVISRRLNVLTLSVSFIFTLLYVAYIVGTGLLKKLSLEMEIVLYCILGIYAALFIALFVLMACGVGAKAKNVKRFSKVLSYFRLVIRIFSLSLSVIALVLATRGGEYAAKYVALDIVLIVFSVICMIFQVIPLLFGGMGKFARWLLSPVKIKYRFSTVALEWYELAVTSGAESKAVKNVSKKYYDEIGVCLDNFLIPELGKKYVSAVKPLQIYAVADKATEENRPLVEGILKNIFAYATECGYVTFDPCRDLKFEGSIDEEEKPKKSVKSRLLGAVLNRFGKPMLDKYIDGVSDKEDK